MLSFILGENNYVMGNSALAPGVSLSDRLERYIHNYFYYY